MIIRILIVILGTIGGGVFGWCTSMQDADSWVEVIVFAFTAFTLTTWLVSVIGGDDTSAWSQTIDDINMSHGTPQQRAIYNQIKRNGKNK